MISPCTEEDYQSFKRKIYQASLKFTHNDGIRVKSTFGNEDHMDAGEFKEFLLGFFNVDVTSGELDVAMKVFDLNHDGIITCADFLSTLYRIQWRAQAQEKRQVETKVQGCIVPRTRTSIRRLTSCMGQCG